MCRAAWRTQLGAHGLYSERWTNILVVDVKSIFENLSEKYSSKSSSLSFKSPLKGSD